MSKKSWTPEQHRKYRATIRARLRSRPELYRTLKRHARTAVKSLHQVTTLLDRL